MPVEPLTPADLYAMIDGIEETHVLVQGQVYDRGDCAACEWCGTIEPVTWLVPLPDSYVCTDCEEERRYETAGDYTPVMGRVI